MVDSSGVISATRHDHNPIFTIVENIRHAGAFVQWALHQGLLHIPQVPDTPLTLRLSVETRGDQRLVVSPLQALLTWTSVSMAFDNR